MKELLPPVTVKLAKHLPHLLELSSEYEVNKTLEGSCSVSLFIVKVALLPVIILPVTVLNCQLELSNVMVTVSPDEIATKLFVPQTWL